MFDASAAPPRFTSVADSEPRRRVARRVLLAEHTDGDFSRLVTPHPMSAACEPSL